MNDHVSSPVQPHRRGFLEWITVALGALATVAFSIPFVGYLLGPLLKKRTVQWVDHPPLGPVDGFPVNETRLVTFDNPIRQPWDGMVAHTGVYVRNLGKDERGQDRFTIFAVNCAHLGCPVTWFPQSGLFMCPCHGGVYYENGDRASGPPPRGLFKVPWKVEKGQLIIQAPHLPTLQDTLEKDDA
jgi:Rieske Fe-S protein